MKKPTNTAAEARGNPASVLMHAMVLGTSGAIEAQEAAGQQEFTESDTLPMTLRSIGEHDAKAILEAFGCRFLGPVQGDPVFQYVRLPKGWSKKATDHAMWSSLLDEHERERASIFYKAAFYDRNAHLVLRTRFSVVPDYDSELYARNYIRYLVLDSGKQVFSTATVSFALSDGSCDWDKCSEVEKHLRAQCETWLTERGITDYGNPAKHWDDSELETE